MRYSIFLAWTTLASCGPEDEPSFPTCPEDRDSECREEYARECEAYVDEQSCVSNQGVIEGAGTNLSCSWLEPTRWTRDGNLCDGVSEPPRCLATYYVGDGGPGCSPHWDRADEGEGFVFVTSSRCAGAYEWGSCAVDDDAPPECSCAGE